MNIKNILEGIRDYMDVESVVPDNPLTIRDLEEILVLAIKDEERELKREREEEMYKLKRLGLR